ncbi:MAG: TetR/AcrR family transcriptional regulator [Lachnospiraceae bacterium]|nr:TetR/AcrR family transcriptional regulator [Lachnospiraceae bacterium]MBQ8326762.1 TetR/AcrR family transcriptional regulator [Lachnospiraceae bacterium]
MSAAFTVEQQDSIRVQLFEAGIHLLKEVGVQRMTVSKLTKAAGIAKGSFYNFFESKEDFLLKLCQYAEVKTWDMFHKRMRGESSMNTHEFMAFLREYMNSDYDLLNGLTVEDFVWIKGHMKEVKPFEPSVLTGTIQTVFGYLSDVRADVDIGIVVNLIKGVYGMRENRETMIETSLEESIEVILRALENYISGKENHGKSKIN